MVQQYLNGHRKLVDGGGSSSFVMAFYGGGLQADDDEFIYPFIFQDKSHLYERQNAL